MTRPLLFVLLLLSCSTAHAQRFLTQYEAQAAPCSPINSSRVVQTDNDPQYKYLVTINCEDGRDFRIFYRNRPNIIPWIVRDLKASPRERTWADTFKTLGLLVLLGGVLAALARTAWYIRQNMPRWNEERRQREEQRKQLQAERDRLADLRPVVQRIDPAEFAQQLFAAYAYFSPRVLRPTIFTELILVARDILTTYFAPPDLLPSAQAGFEPYKQFFDAVLQGLLDFTNKAPELYCTPDAPDSVMHKFVMITPDLPALQALARPLRPFPYLRDKKHFNHARHLELPHSQDYDDQRRYERDKREYDKAAAKLLEAQTPAELALSASVWYPYAYRLNFCEQVKVEWTI